MAFLQETSTWEPGVYQLEPTDLVAGGVAGASNTQPRQLLNRTKYLYDALTATDLVVAGLQSSYSQLSSDVGDAETDITSIRTDITNIQNNTALQGIEAEQFFMAIAF